nr:MAG: late protein 2 [Felis catus papillomavirus]
MTSRAKRIKRDSASNLYRHCLQGGDCIPDVVNKFEAKTPADKILQIGSSVTYFGGAGIGTGRGTGGATGYRPLAGEGVRVGGRPSVLRPSVPVDPLGAIDVAPVDVGGGGGGEIPSIIPLEDVTPTAGVDAPTVTTAVDAVGGEASTTGGGPLTGPSVATSSTDDTAILEVGSSSTPGSRQRVSRQQYNNPTFTPITQSTPTAGEAALGDSVVVSLSGGSTIIGGGGEGFENFEEIELQDFGVQRQPQTSTPEGTLQGLLSRARELYNRRLRQVPVSSKVFLGDPRGLVEYGFENPAYDPFEEQVFPTPGRPEAAPTPGFEDIGALGPARFSAGEGGRLRVSRVGSRKTIRLRSGTYIGERVHYYQDVSTIGETLEMSVLGEQSGDTTIVLSQEGTMVDGLSDHLHQEEELLLDELDEDFSGVQLSLMSPRGRSVAVDLPPLTDVNFSFLAPNDLGDGLFISYPSGSGRPTRKEGGSLPFPISPPLPFDSVTATFDLHPGLKHRKRKRKHHGL